MPRKPRIVSDELKEKLTDLRSKNMTIQQISDQVGEPRETVRRLLLKVGLPNRVPISLDLADYSDVDHLWMREFIGFFMGEGYCGIDRNLYNSHKASYQVRLSIGVREDDQDVIFDIRNHLGGNVIFHERQSNSPTRRSCQWQIVGWSGITNLLSILLSGAFPAKKRNDLSIMNELCQKRLTWPYNLSRDQVDEIHQYYVALKEIKRYKGSEG